MLWSTIDFRKLVRLNILSALKTSSVFAMLDALLMPMRLIADETLYKMQHTGATIYLEKVLNEWFSIVGYDRQSHEATKKVYIEDVPEPEKLYINLPEEDDVIFLEDDGADSELDIFVDNGTENDVAYSFIIFIPNTIEFQETKVRALVDSYRYFGKKYIIQTYEP